MNNPKPGLAVEISQGSLGRGRGRGTMPVDPASQLKDRCTVSGMRQLHAGEGHLHLVVWLSASNRRLLCPRAKPSAPLLSVSAFIGDNKD